MTDIVLPPLEYGNWLAGLTQRIQSAQQRAVLSVNRELVFVQEVLAHLPWFHQVTLKVKALTGGAADD
jgi:hypothetical protein